MKPLNIAAAIVGIIIGWYISARLTRKETAIDNTVNRDRWSVIAEAEHITRNPEGTS